MFLGGSVQLVPLKTCAFVTYTTREAAEKAVEALQNKLILKGERCRLFWGKPQEQRPVTESRGPIMLPPQVCSPDPEIFLGRASDVGVWDRVLIKGFFFRFVVFLKRQLG